MTRDDTHRYLIAYDIPDDRRRVRIAKALQRYGDRVQYSVFIVDASLVRIERLERKLEELIEPHSDAVLLCDIGRVAAGIDRRFRRLGRERPLTDADSFIV